MYKYYYVETTICDSEGEYDLPSVMKIDSEIDVMKNHADIEKEFILEHWDSEAVHREDGWFLHSFIGNRNIYLGRFRPVPVGDYRVLSKYIYAWEYEGEE